MKIRPKNAKKSLEPAVLGQKMAFLHLLGNIGGAMVVRGEGEEGHLRPHVGLGPGSAGAWKIVKKR